MRFILFILIALIAGVIALVKMAAGRATGNEKWKNANTRSEAADLIQKTAKGVSWMEKQWEDAKREADGERGNQSLSRKRDE